MISALIMINLLYLLGIFIMRKDRKELIKMFSEKQMNGRSTDRRMGELKMLIIVFYAIEVLIWIFVGILTMIILEYFNLI